MPKFNYPKVRRDETILDCFHGVEIKDHYRWLEDPDSDETKQFVAEQNKITEEFLSTCKHRSKIKERLTELWNYAKFSCPFKEGDYYYFYKNSGLQNQSVMYQQCTLDGEAHEFLDPNKFSEDGTTALKSCEFSDDGKLLAYMYSEKGSDWAKISFKSVETGHDEPEVLENVKFSCLTWTKDNRGIFYNRYPSSIIADGTAVTKNEYQELCYHVVGTKQSEDVVCARFPDEPNWMGHAEVSECGNYVIMSISKSCDPVNQLWYYDLRSSNFKISENLPFIKLIENFDASYSYVVNEESLFTFKTNLDAPNYRLINFDLSKSKPDIIELVPEKQDVLLNIYAVNKNILILNYMHHCKEELYLYDLLSGKELKKLSIDIGTISQITARKRDNWFFFKFASFTSPGDIYQYRFVDGVSIHSLEPTIFRRSEFKGLDLTNFKTEQVFYESKDGTKIPMFIVSKKNLEKNSNNPTILYGYGGFNISLTPSFSVVRLIWIQHFNGIYASANLRGGGEYGEAWYNSGRRFNKQNVFDDFISAGEFLCKNNYTTKNRLAINGGSNGGLLVTASINQRPDLFHAAIADVSVCDMLRFHKFTIGSYWVSDYGCSDDKADFEYMIKYSPLHTISKGKQYPYLLLATADHDDRVVPSHSYKYIAELQYQNGEQENPLLIRIDTKSGHGAGKPTSKVIEEYADKYAFLSGTMNLDWTD